MFPPTVYLLKVIFSGSRKDAPTPRPPGDVRHDVRLDVRLDVRISRRTSTAAGYRRRWADRTRTPRAGKTRGRARIQSHPRGWFPREGGGTRTTPRWTPRGTRPAPPTRAPPSAHGAPKVPHPSPRTPPEVPRVPASTPPRAIPKAQPPLCTRGSYPRMTRRDPRASGFPPRRRRRASSSDSTATRPTTSSVPSRVSIRTPNPTRRRRHAYECEGAFP